MAMTDNKNDGGAPDRDRINMNEEYEVRVRTKSFGMSNESLQEAVDQVGTSADTVREYLRD